MIFRWIENVKWLFNHPPVVLTSETPKGTKCAYCGVDNKLYSVKSLKWAICYSCIKAVCDKTLKQKPL